MSFLNLTEQIVHPGAPSANKCIFYCLGGEVYAMSDNGIPVLLTGVSATVDMIAGAGLTGGGDLSANRTFNVVAADGSIIVGANDISVGVISDTQHGTRAGGTLHAAATTGVNGFMSAADKTKLDGVEAAAAADQVANEVSATAISGLIGSDVQALLESLNERGHSIKIKNTDTTTNIAGTASAAFDELTGSVDWNDNASRYTPNTGAGQVTINTAGRYKVSFAAAWIESSGNTARDTIRIWFELAGTQIGPNFQNNYLRDSSGANEAGQIGTLTFDATAGQALTVHRQRIGGAGGNIVLEGTENYMQVEFVR